jgi:DNA-binding CsgD family transcriptional regulator/tetratricopeptide (TPR) repeat protein
MRLLEREEQLAAMSAALADMVSGEGRVVLVGGEAGIGKTTMIAEFLRRTGRFRVLQGTCENLDAARPFGPLIDMTLETGGELLRLVDRAASPVEVFRGLHKILREPTVLVFEDVHWADAATLDLLKMLGRRIAPLPALVIVSYRDDEIDHRHPLRGLLGALATSRAVRRIQVDALTQDAVSAMAEGSGIDPTELHRRTGGNPFFVSEVLADGRPDGVPRPVREIIMARAAELDARSRQLLDSAAVIGARVEPALLDGNAEELAEALRACEGKGLLQSSGSLIRFRHDIVRQAVQEAIPAPRRIALHQNALRNMNAAGGQDPARLALHAYGAGDAAAVLQHAPVAAARACAAGAHREAAALYARALEYAEAAEERTALLEAFGTTCAKLDRQSDAVTALEDAAEIYTRNGAEQSSGRVRSAMASALVRLGRNAEADQASRAAISTLEALGESTDLAEAMRVHAHLRMLDRDKEQALFWGRRAIDLGQKLQSAATVAGASMAVGAALMVADDPRGLGYLKRCLQISRRDGLQELEALAYGNMGSAYGETYHLLAAEEWLERGIAFAAANDLDYVHHYCVAWLAIVQLYRGDWSEAELNAQRVLSLPGVPAVSRIMALIALGRVRARRGAPGDRELLDEALDLAEPTGTLQRIAPVRAARAEAAHLGGDAQAAQTEAEAAWSLALKHRHPWHAGELAFWRAHGGTAGAPDWTATPFALQLAGDWHQAARAWDALGCPYEAARALAAGDSAAKLQALQVFDELGARPAADQLRRELRQAGVRSIPRGPTAATRGNILGLTPRQMEILALLAQGLPNSRIARRLRISTRTVDHHVAAILARLDVTSRAEAASIAQGMVVGGNPT